jgi:hypothetical protein
MANAQSLQASFCMIGKEYSNLKFFLVLALYQLRKYFITEVPVYLTPNSRLVKKRLSIGYFEATRGYVIYSPRRTAPR